MSNLLDQDEVDALLRAVEEGELGDDAASDDSSTAVAEAPTAETQPTKEFRTYDFKRPERVSKDQMRAFEGLHERFARNFGAALSGYLRTIIEIKVRNIEQLTYAEFTYSLPVPTTFCLLDASALEGQLCMEISPLIIFPIIDRMLGGSTSELYIPQRALTQIEQRLANRIIERAIEALTEAWSNIVDVTFDVKQIESNPQLIQVVAPNEVVVVIVFDLKMGDRTGPMSLCVPFNAIEPVIGLLTSQDWFSYKRKNASENHQGSIIDNLREAKLKMRAYLARTSMTVNDLLTLKPGDVIQTKKEATDDLVLRIEGKSKYAGKVGQFRGSKAFKITRKAKPAEKL